MAFLRSFASTCVSVRERSRKTTRRSTFLAIVGIVAARYVRSTARAGLFALTLGVAYVVYVEWSSGLWYYMAAHATRFDQFFFTAPILAPVIFTTGACLLWHALAKDSPNAL